MSDEIAFRESQSMRQWWLWAIVLGVQAISFILVFREEGISTGIWLWIIFPMFGINGLLYFAKLVTEVREEGIYLRFIPFHFKWVKIDYTDIEQYESIKYNPMRDYGGWGIKWGREGKAYNVSGNLGVKLMLNDGKRIMIGSQRPDQMVEAISKFNS